jgi:hypothetical protein
MRLGASNPEDAASAIQRVLLIVECRGELTVNSPDQELLHRADALVLGAKSSEHLACSRPAEALEQIVEVVDCQQSALFAELANEFKRVTELLADRTCAGAQLLNVDPSRREAARQPKPLWVYDARAVPPARRPWCELRHCNSGDRHGEIQATARRAGVDRDYRSIKVAERDRQESASPAQGIALYDEEIWILREADCKLLMLAHQAD